ncbi:MAG TPA: glycosyltransferase family A protein [Myxococcaceae bacterium]|nr:glycosyltransferase family A protein [Myxococcaceae bacterium]
MAAPGGEMQLSVVIPTRDRARFVDVALASVLASPLIKEPTQIIVVDDDSHDETASVVRERGCRYLHVNNHNIGRTRNDGFALVQSPYVAFLDSDDAWLPGNMEPQLAALESHPGAAFAYGIARCAKEDLEPLPWTFPNPPLVSGVAPERFHLGYANLGVVLFRREAVLDIGGFSTRILYHQDADLMIRIAARREIVGVDFVGMLHRIRDPSRARANYYWGNRLVKNWWPRGVGAKTAAKFMIKTRSLYFDRFIEDTAACVACGQKKDALVCLTRAVRVSPGHAIRHPRRIARLLFRSLQ